MSKFIVVVAAIAVLFMPVTALTDAESEIKAILDFSADVWNEKDVASIANFYHKEFVLVSDQGVVTLEQHLKELRDIVDAGEDRGELDRSNIVVKKLDEDNALAYGRLILKFKDGSTIYSWFTIVYVKTPFGWKAILQRS